MFHTGPSVTAAGTRSALPIEAGLAVTAVFHERLTVAAPIAPRADTVVAALHAGGKRTVRARARAIAGANMAVAATGIAHLIMVGHAATGGFVANEAVTARRLTGAGPTIHDFPAGLPILDVAAGPGAHRGSGFGVTDPLALAGRSYAPCAASSADGVGPPRVRPHPPRAPAAHLSGELPPGPQQTVRRPMLGRSPGQRVERTSIRTDLPSLSTM